MRSRFPATAAFILALSASQAALAQDDAGFLDRANDYYSGPDRAVPDARRSDLALIPALAKMAPPPESVSTALRAALVTPSSKSWPAASEWASAAPQQAVLDAIRTVGEPLGVSRRYAFLLPYGENNASQEARDANMIVRVGDPPVLASAQFVYLRTLGDVAALVNVEATRLADDNKAPEAATLLIRWTLFCRQIADREFFGEKQWGLRNAIAGLERLRDLVNEYPAQFTGSGLAEVIADLSEDYIGAERLQMPRADLLAGKQIVSRAFVERQGPSEAFGATMARASAGDRPLRLFGEASRWQDLASKHGTTYETGDALDGVFGDWEYRWRLPEFDRGRKQATDFDRLSKDKFAAVHLISEGVQEMFELRQRLRAEVEATRLSLGVMGYKLDNGVFPPSLAGIRPRYVKTIGVDPYNERREEFHYFVPIRDQPRGERELPKPHDIALALPVGARFVGTELFGEMLPGNMEKDSLAEVRAEFMDADMSEFEAELTAQRKAAEALPEAQKKQAMAALDVMAIGVDILRRMQATPEFEAIVSVSDPESVPVSRQRELVRAAAERFVQIKDDVIAGLSPEAKASLEAGVSTRREGFVFGLRDDTFILYSAGVDQTRQWARGVGEGAPDMLYWPPALSLLRERFSAVAGDPLSVTDEILWITPSTRGPQTGPGR